MSEFDFSIGIQIVLMGGGISFFLVAAIFQEIPYIQMHAPEGLCLSSNVLLAINAGLLIPLVFYFVHKFCYLIPYDVSIPFVISLSGLLAITFATVYETTIDGNSWPLYIFSFFAGGIGNLNCQILIPYLMKFKTVYLIFGRSGGDFLSLLLVVVVFIQFSRGIAQPYFLPSAFFFAIGLFLLCGPLGSYISIEYNQLGYKDKIDTQDSSIADERIPILQVSCSVEEEDLKIGSELEKSSHLNTEYYENYRIYLISCVIWVDFHTWSLLTSCIPFGFANVTTDLTQSSMYLHYAINLSVVTLFLGGLSNYWFTIPPTFCISIFTLLAAFIYAVSFGAPMMMYDSVLAPVLVLVFVASRFFEAHLTTAVFNIISSEFPESMQESTVQALGLADMIAVAIGCLVGFLVFNYSGFFVC